MGCSGSKAAATDENANAPPATATATATDGSAGEVADVVADVVDHFAYASLSTSYPSTIGMFATTHMPAGVASAPECAGAGAAVGTSAGGEDDFAYPALSTSHPSTIGMFATTHPHTGAGGAKNAAFVFIKPHAVTDAVKKLVEDTFAAKGITVLSTGTISSEDIDKKKLIDQHYYAIASKATILKPHELNVPADKFKAKFGVEWQATLDSGRVMNAMDACAELGLDGDGIELLWRACADKGNVIKFGGGFYCGLVEAEGKEPLYVFNAFFMQMRSSFTAPGRSIIYYSVEFSPDTLGWSDFRGQVLGPTKPAEAPKTSIRGMVYERWSELGLEAQPNGGDNAVHASASPFEGLAERMNWLGASIEEDAFGSMMTAAGITVDTIKQWSVDPQVMVDGKLGSLFDALEDTDVDACLDKLVAINAENGGGGSSGPKNTAFVFIKPHAVTDAVKELVSSNLAAKGVKILEEGSISSEEIDSKKLIDQHYYAIASKATILKPHELNVPADKFKAQFGLEWQAALDSGKVMNAMDGCAALGKTADEMDTLWGICKKAKKLVKFGGGFYCGLIEVDGKDPLYIFNGFFMSMRSKFTAPGLSIYYYVVEFDASKLSWGDFRGKVLGPTDPADAPADALRGLIYAQWEALGLKGCPDVGDNGVHASASPFEALAERANWLGRSIVGDSFGDALLGAGISEDAIKAWSVDPQVLVGGAKGSLFDSVEDTDSSDCIAKLVATNAENASAAPTATPTPTCGSTAAAPSTSTSSDGYAQMSTAFPSTIGMFA